MITAAFVPPKSKTPPKRPWSVADKKPEVDLRHLDLAEPLRRLDFSPGLNLIVGPSGSGKSTVINAIARNRCCFEFGVQWVDSDATKGMAFESWNDNGPLWREDPYQVECDGGAVALASAERRLGEMQGYKGFEGPFMSEYFRGLNRHKSSSSGERSLAFFSDFVKDDGSCVIPPKAGKPKWSESYRAKEAYRLFDDLGDPEGKVPTLLLDEPDRALDIPAQWEFWKRVSSLKGVQIIAISHSPFAMGLPNATYHEAVPGFREKARNLISLLTG